MSAPRPHVLVAELTYRCPLRCAYCSNPTSSPKGMRGLDASTWRRVLSEAEALGVVQVHLTGGEPLLYDGLESVIAKASQLGLYTSLITSGVPLARERLDALATAGLDALQLSIQAIDPVVARRIAGVDAFEQKMRVAGWARELDLPLTVNVVLHRDNLGEIDELVALAEHLGAERLELANTQYLGWAYENRAALMPLGRQIDAARARASAAKERLKGKMDVLFVLPDYFGDRPRTCMSGWGSRYIVVAPDGRVMPCQAAHVLPIDFPSVKDASLAELWSGEAFERYRGTSWMKEPCRSCDKKDVDFGGCRCQAFLLTGDAAAADPVCSLSPKHHVVEAARAGTAGVGELQLRKLPLAR